MRKYEKNVGPQPNMDDVENFDENDLEDVIYG